MKKRQIEKHGNKHNRERSEMHPPITALQLKWGKGHGRGGESHPCPRPATPLADDPGFSG